MRVIPSVVSQDSSSKSMVVFVIVKRGKIMILNQFDIW